MVGKARVDRVRLHGGEFAFAAMLSIVAASCNTKDVETQVAQAPTLAHPTADTTVDQEPANDEPVENGSVADEPSEGTAVEDEPIEDKPTDFELTIHPIRELDWWVPVTAEFRNRSERTQTIILPQDGSSAGWLDPQYLYTVKTANGRDVAMLGRCGNYGGTYDESTMIPVGPGETLYVYDALPSDLTYENSKAKYKRISVFLEYIVKNPRMIEHGHERGDLDWPGQVFVGHLRSNTVAVDFRKPLPVLDDQDARFDVPRYLSVGHEEPGLYAVVYPRVLHTQNWEDNHATIALFNATKQTIGLANSSGVTCEWTDAQGHLVKPYHYAGIGQRYHGSGELVLPETLEPGEHFLLARPLGFFKEASGTFKVACRLDHPLFKPTRENNMKVAFNALERLEVPLSPEEIEEEVVSHPKPSACTGERTRIARELRKSELPVFGKSPALLRHIYCDGRILKYEAAILKSTSGTRFESLPEDEEYSLKAVMLEVLKPARYKGKLVWITFSGKPGDTYEGEWRNNGARLEFSFPENAIDEVVEIGGSRHELVVYSDYLIDVRFL